MVIIRVLVIIRLFVEIIGILVTSFMVIIRVFVVMTTGILVAMVKILMMVT